MLAANACTCINIWSWVSSYNVVFLPLNFSVDIDTQPASWYQIACNVPKVWYTKGHSITPKTVLNREMDTLRVESNGSPSRYISLLKYFGLIGKYFLHADILDERDWMNLNKLVTIINIPLLGIIRLTCGLLRWPEYHTQIYLPITVSMKGLPACILLRWLESSSQTYIR